MYKVMAATEVERTATLCRSSAANEWLLMVMMMIVTVMVIAIGMW